MLKMKFLIAPAVLATLIVSVGCSKKGREHMREEHRAAHAKAGKMEKGNGGMKQQQGQMTACSTCGMMMSADQKFCPMCGPQKPMKHEHKRGKKS